AAGDRDGHHRPDRIVHRERGLLGGRDPPRSHDRTPDHLALVGSQPGQRDGRLVPARAPCAEHGVPARDAVRPAPDHRRHVHAWAVLGPLLAVGILAGDPVEDLNMEKRSPSPFRNRDRIVLACVGIVVVASTVLFARNDREQEWRYYQAEFRDLVAEKYGAEKAAEVPDGMQQIWVPALATADRCITCHQATSWKGFEEAEHPFSSHPQELLASHPPAKFGCTSCHGGQGWAVDFEPA